MFTLVRVSLFIRLRFLHTHHSVLNILLVLPLLSFFLFFYSTTSTITVRAVNLRDEKKLCSREISVEKISKSRVSKFFQLSQNIRFS